MKFILILVLVGSVAQAHWGIDNIQNPNQIFNSLRDKVLNGFLFNDTYQIGETWGKEQVTAEKVNFGSPAYRQAARQTLKVYANFRHRGTAFYIGKFNNTHVVATNYHVFENGMGGTICSNSYVEALFVDDQPLTMRCKESIGLWSDVDFALFTVTVDPSKEYLLEGVGRNLSFHLPVHAGQALLTVGFGVANNPARVMMANQDDECFTFSPEVRYIADPDDLNPGPYKVWSFANGCDISHGDSGSAMFDRNTGDIVGIIWTGRIPKNAKVRDNEYLQRIYEAQSEDIWKELSFAAPSTHIAPILDQVMNAPATPVHHKAILAEILDN